MKGSWFSANWCPSRSSQDCYLCEVRVGQYWRLKNLKSFDEFSENRFPESWRKAYYLMLIHEYLPPEARTE